MNDERYPQQLELELNKTVDATREEWDEWQEKELSWLAKKQLTLVAIMSVVQVTMLGFMLVFMYINSIIF